jgi:hypothetical protein
MNKRGSPESGNHHLRAGMSCGCTQPPPKGPFLVPCVVQAEVGRAMPLPTDRAASYERGGVVFVGTPNTVVVTVGYPHALTSLADGLGQVRQGFWWSFAPSD